VGGRIARRRLPRFDADGPVLGVSRRCPECCLRGFRLVAKRIVTEYSAGVKGYGREATEP
jgi:hypothetical protein